MLFNILNFDEKFQHIFSKHPSIKSYADLAKALGVSASTITNWKNGTVTSHPGIPMLRVPSICQHLLVSQETLELSDFSEFLRRIRQPQQPSLWNSVVLSGDASSSRISLFRGRELATTPVAALSSRGLYDPEDVEAGIPVYKAGEDMLVKVVVDDKRHVALFLNDRNGWQRLHPTVHRTKTDVEGVFLFPEQTNPLRPRFVRTDSVVGAQVLVAVMTADPLPQAVLQPLLQANDLPATLEQLAMLLRGGEFEHDIASARFHVEG